jgi:hypothetical protein
MKGDQASDVDERIDGDLFHMSPLSFLMDIYPAHLDGIYEGNRQKAPTSVGGAVTASSLRRCILVNIQSGGVPWPGRNAGPSVYAVEGASDLERPGVRELPHRIG